MKQLNETIQDADPMANHRCEKLAAVRHIGPGREWWIGKLLEPLPGHPLETHCMHITTPYKSVVWGMTVGDFEAYAVLCQVVHEQPLNPNWLVRMAESYRKEAVKLGGRG